jgi:hypothetical protein
MARLKGAKCRRECLRKKQQDEITVHSRSKIVGQGTCPLKFEEMT